MKVLIKHYSLLTLFLSIFPLDLFAEEFLYTCISDKDWMMNFEINDEKKSVFLRSSGSIDGSNSFNTNKYEKVIHFSDNQISTITRYNESTSSIGSTSYRTFFLNKNIMLNTGHYPAKIFDNQIFNCIRG